MAQIPKGRLVKGLYKSIRRDCAIYFSITVLAAVFNNGSFMARWWQLKYLFVFTLNYLGFHDPI